MKAKQTFKNSANHPEQDEAVGLLHESEETIFSFLENETTESIYNSLGEKLYQLSGADYMIMSEYNEQHKSVSLRQLYGVQPFMGKIAQMVGIDFNQIRIPVKDLVDQLDFTQRNKIYFLEGGLYDLTTQKIPKIICNKIEKILSIEKIFSIGLIWKGNYHGGITFGFKKGHPFKKRNLVESIINQAALALSRKYAEEALISSEERLRTSEEKYRMLFESNPHSMWVYDLNTLAFLAVNDTAIAKYGYSRDEFLNMTIKEIRPVKDIPKLLDIVSQVKEGLNISGNWQHQKRDGTIIDVEIISHTLMFEGKHAELVLANDITERKRAELELIIAKEKAEESDRLKSAFLANISHELRTPLNALIGFSGLIHEELPMSEVTSFAQRIHKSGNNLLEIVESIFDLSMLESGQVQLQNEKFSLGNFMKDLNSIVWEEQQKLNKQNLVINDISETCEVFIYSDQQKLKQVMINLLRNALKFTILGKIEYGYVMDQKKDSNRIKFFVNDTGIGISEPQKSIIFDRFRQADDTYTRKFGGTGIGLTVSKQTIELLGGHIGVDSEPGKGSSFYFTIPLQVEPEKENSTPNQFPTLAPESQTNKLKLVIAEDDEVSAQFLQIIIKEYCKEIIWVNNGREVVEACRNNPDFDIVLMDIQMPEMDGYEATRHIRQFNKEIIIVAQTAYALAGDNEKALMAGCTDYISKPIKKEPLLVMLQKYFNSVS